MNILVVSSFLPSPLFSGGHIRLYNILKRLSEKNTITLVCEKRNYQTQEDIKEVKKFCKEVIIFERKKQWSLRTILNTGFSFKPFLIVGHTNQEMQREIKRLLKNDKFDIIHVETSYVMQNVPKTSVPIVLVEHNIEYLVYKRYVDRLPILIRPLLYLDLLKLKYWEQKFWQKADKLVTVSSEEKKLTKRNDVTIVPNGVDVEKFKIQSFDKAQDKNSKFKIDKKEKRILFIGDFKWMQNRDALEWILKEIWPELKFKVQSSKFKVILWIVGRNIPEYFKRLTNDKNIFFDEDASKDTVEIFGKADVLLAPIRVGGGTSFKILEAMASGIPVVTTPLGMEGIKAIENKEILLADTPKKFANKIGSLLQNENLYRDIAENARSLIEKKYNWETIVKQLEDVYKSTIGMHH